MLIPSTADTPAATLLAVSVSSSTHTQPSWMPESNLLYPSTLNLASQAPDSAMLSYSQVIPYAARSSSSPSMISHTADTSA